ncbi:hypothetical protein H9P43_004133 [Blastocladiella emersonii ATCC 22665]|nr:hypothetical protein H9P43_004133 [Blastocladiella emersonii ATCC 22665]
MNAATDPRPPRPPRHSLAARRGSVSSVASSSSASSSSTTSSLDDIDLYPPASSASSHALGYPAATAGTGQPQQQPRAPMITQADYYYPTHIALGAAASSSPAVPPPRPPAGTPVRSFRSVPPAGSVADDAVIVDVADSPPATTTAAGKPYGAAFPLSIPVVPPLSALPPAAGLQNLRRDHVPQQQQRYGTPPPPLPPPQPAFVPATPDDRERDARRISGGASGTAPPMLSPPRPAYTPYPSYSELSAIDSLGKSIDQPSVTATNNHHGDVDDDDGATSSCSSNSDDDDDDKFASVVGGVSSPRRRHRRCRHHQHQHQYDPKETTGPGPRRRYLEPVPDVPFGATRPWLGPPEGLYRRDSRATIASTTSTSSTSSTSTTESLRPPRTCFRIVPLQPAVYIMILVHGIIAVWSVYSKVMFLDDALDKDWRLSRSHFANVLVSIVINFTTIVFIALGLYGVRCKSVAHFHMFYAWEVVATTILFFMLVTVLVGSLVQLQHMAVDPNTTPEEMSASGGTATVIFLVPAVGILVRVYILVLFKRFLRALDYYGFFAGGLLDLALTPTVSTIGTTTATATGASPGRVPLSRSTTADSTARTEAEAKVSKSWWASLFPWRKSAAATVTMPPLTGHMRVRNTSTSMSMATTGPTSTISVIGGGGTAPTPSPSRRRQSMVQVYH